MGLDMYAYVAAKRNQSDEFWQDAVMDPDTKEFVNPNVEKPREIAYWRKHPNLHGWMRRLWESQGNSGSFNGDELELTWQDLDRLENDVKNNRLARLDERGFFFGDPSDEYYREHDLKFVRDAKAEVFVGLKVFYNSSW